MTRTIKNNLIRVLTVLVAITCAFSILTMPRTSASANSTKEAIALEDFWMVDDVKLNVTTEQKSGIQFSAKTNIDWAKNTDREDALANLFPGVDAENMSFGIVIDDKYYSDENGDLQERTEVTVDSKTAIKISYIKKSDFAQYKNPVTEESWFTGGIATYTASITYREETLRADFVAHDKALKEQVASGEIKAEDAKYYFTNGEPNDAEFKALMDKVYGERLMARAYVEVVTENGTEYVYSQNTVTASVRGVATGKYLEYEDDEKWEQDYGWVATKYLGEFSRKNAFVDLESGEIVGVDLRGYVGFTMGEEDLTVGDSRLDADLVIGEKSYFGISLAEGTVAGQTYALTATDMSGNVLLLKLTPATKVLKTKEDIYNTFNLSTNNKTYCKPVGNGVSCTIDGYFVLGNDIDMTGVILDHNLICARETGTTAPAYGVGFYGTFDGNGYTISNLDLRRANTGLTTISTSPDFRKAAVRDENGVLTSSTSSYHAVVADTHECNHDAVSGVGTRGAGLFGALGYGSTIKNVALTNVNASHSSVIAVMTEGAQSNYDGGASTYVGFGGYDEVSSSGYAWRYTSGVTTCTQATGCPVHGSDTASCDGGYYGKCTGTRFCIIHQTGVDHTAEWIPLVKLGTAYYADFACENIYIRKDLTLTADQAKITYENIFIDINEDTINFRGVFNMLGSSKVDKITTMNNVVINYNGADATIASTGILRGHNLVSTTGNHGIAFEKTTINDMVVISKNPANLITNNGPYVASNLDGTKKIANVLQYSSYADYLTAIKLGVSIDGFKNLNYWDVKKYGVPYWKTSLEDVYFKVDGEASDGTLEYSAPAIGNQKQYQVTAYNLLDEAFPEFDAVSSTNEDVATVTKQGLITIKGTTSSPEATAVVTLTALGKVFTAVITLQGGYTEVSAETEITYSQDQGKFDFGGYAVDPDDNPETENSVAVSNANIVSASVIYGEEIIELTKQTIQIKDYGTLANNKHWSTNPGGVGSSSADSGTGYNTVGDQATSSRYDTTVAFDAFFGGDLVRYAVNGTKGEYTPDLKTQKLLVKFNVGTDEAPIYKTYLFENLKAYTAIINNIDQLNTLLQLDTAGEINKGYYILANNIIADRGGYKIKHEYSALSGGAGFQGVFDGQGYYIAGLANNTSTSKRNNQTVTVGGLFGNIISTAEMPTTIRNLSFTKYADSCYVGFADSLISDSYTTQELPDGSTIQVAEYPVEFYNVHYKPKTSSIHGLFYASSSVVNYKLRNVVVNFDNLRAHQTYNNSNYFNGDVFGMIYNTPEYGYENQTPHVETFAKAAFYAEPFENVVLIANLPVVGYIENSNAGNGYSAKDPLDTYYMGYGWNKIGKAGMKIARIAQANAKDSPSNLANLVFDVLASQATLTPFVGDDSKAATPWASAAATGTEYSITDPSDASISKNYTTTYEQAFFFKGIYQFYNISEMNAAITLAEGGATDDESKLINTLIAEGMPFKISSAVYGREGIYGRTIEWAQGNNG